MKRRRSLLLVGIILLVFVGTPGWLMYREVQQERLNRTLIEAIKREDTKAALLALKQGANANTQDAMPDERSTWERLLERLRSGFRPASQQWPKAGYALHIAYGFSFDEHRIEFSSTVQTEVIKALIRHGANVNLQVEGWAFSPLMLAISVADCSLAQFLLDHGADVNARDSSGQTALMETALAVDSVRKANLLLDYGADINAQDDQGETILHEAAYFNDSDLIKLLLERGARVNISTKSGETPLKIVKAARNSAIVKLLQQAGAKE